MTGIRGTDSRVRASDLGATMKRANRAAFTAAALLSCTLTFSGCSLISQALPQQDGTAGEQAEADGQDQGTGSTESDEAGGDEPASDSSASSADEGSAASEAGTSSDEDTSGAADGASGLAEGQSSGSEAEVSLGA